MEVTGNIIIKKTYRILGVDLSKIMCITLAIIGLMDTSCLWNIYLPGKLFTYSLKFLNIIFFLYLIQQNSKNKYSWALFSIPLLWFTLVEGSIPLTAQYFVSAVVPVMSFMLLKDEWQVDVAKIYMNIVYYLFLIGIPIYILINFLPFISLPHLTLSRDLDGRSYLNYFFLYYTREGQQFRFMSIFDEPGVVGTMVPIILLYFGSNLSRFKFIVFVTAGLLSWSLFYILFIFPVIYFYKIRIWDLKKKIQRVFLFIISIILVYVGFVQYAKTTKEDPVLASLIYYRFEWEDGWITGFINNRDKMIGFNDGYQNFIEEGGETVWIGNDKDSAKRDFKASGLSYRIVIYEKGLLIVIFLGLYYICMHPWRKQLMFSLISIAFLAAIFWQRPLMTNISFIAIIYVGVKFHSINFSTRKTLPLNKTI